MYAMRYFLEDVINTFSPLIPRGGQEGLVSDVTGGVGIRSGPKSAYDTKQNLHRSGGFVSIYLKSHVEL